MPLMVPDTTFYTQERDKWVVKKASDIFGGKRTVVFAVPAAFSSVCESHVSGYEKNYNRFKKAGIDQVYCTSVNDIFTMRSWADTQHVKKVKMLPDGNGDFARAMGMLVDKTNFGFGMRSWRYAVVINSNHVDKMYIENGKAENLWPDDPINVTDAETVLKFLEK